jgi:hypothetical protein
LSQHIPVIPVLGKLRQEGCEFKGSLGYIAKPCLKKRKNNNKRTMTYSPLNRRDMGWPAFQYRAN